MRQMWRTLGKPVTRIHLEQAMWPKSKKHSACGCWYTYRSLNRSSDNITAHARWSISSHSLLTHLLKYNYIFELSFWHVRSLPEAPFTYKFTSIPTWICKCFHFIIRDEIIYPFQNFICYTVEFCEWIHKVVPDTIGHLNTYPYWDWN